MLVGLGAAIASAEPPPARPGPVPGRNSTKGSKPDEAERSEQARRFYYLAPRAYPRLAIDPAAVERAVQRLRGLFGSLGRYPIGPLATLMFEGLRLKVGPPCLWHSAGPSNLNGRVTGLAISPANPSHILASTVGGLWRSLDGARSWQRVSDDLGAICMGAIAVAPENDNLVFAGRGDPNLQEVSYGGTQYGLFVSSAAGDPGSWTRIGPALLERQFVSRIRVGPGLHPEVFAATSAGVVHGAWGGTDWTWSLFAGMNAPVSDVAVDFSTSPPLVYAAVYRADVAAFPPGVYRFPGATTPNAWERLASGFPSNSAWIALALAPSNRNVLYAKVAGVNRRLLGVFRRESGGSWKDRTPSSTSVSLDDSDSYTDYNCAIEVDPTDENLVYVGGVKLCRTLDASLAKPAWAALSTGNDLHYLDAPVHDDVHAIAFVPGNPDIVLVGNDGGIDQSSDLSRPIYHWEDRSHGMIATQFYRVGVQQEAAGAFAGGGQDNGSALTFGNRTWYSTNRNCDGSDVAIEPGPSSTFYFACVTPNCSQTHVDAVPNPIPGTSGGGTTLSYSAPGQLYPPIVTAPVAGTGERGRALAAACPGSSAQKLLRTTNGLDWDWLGGFSTPTAMDTVSAIAIAPSSDFTTYYVGFRGRAGASHAGLWTTKGGGTTRLLSDLGLPELSPNAIAVDSNNPDRAYVALGGDAGGAGLVLVTSNQGDTWERLDGPGAADVFAAPATGIVIDPRDRDLLYLSSAVGVFRVKIGTASPLSATYEPMSDGLPFGVDVTSLALAQGPYRLLAGTMGYGAYTLELGVLSCPPVVLSVRDNVFDVGFTPSPNGIPDPEHPIVDALRVPDALGHSFYRSDNRSGESLNWWSSPDIRLHRMDPARPENELAWADGVAIETCPTEASDCIAGTNIDAQARRGDSDTVYVQVTNRGYESASGIRVMALWGDATLGLPSLPTNFWSAVFPPSGGCQALPASAPWHTFDPVCIEVGDLRPEESRVLTFRWDVPSWAANHSCILAFVDSPDDPTPARAAGELDPDVFVKTNHQIGLRNLHIADGVEGAATVAGDEDIPITNSGDDSSTVDVEVSRGTLPVGARLALLLPPALGARLEGIVRVPAVLTASEERRASRMGADRGAWYVVERDSAAVRGILLPPHSSRKLGLSYDTRRALPRNTAARFTILARRHGSVVGGGTYILRAR
ncbi:MAG: hypothetical protein ABI960_02810 [Candidatus Eisenbacteria bacterium]